MLPIGRTRHIQQGRVKRVWDGGVSRFAVKKCLNSDSSDSSDNPERGGPSGPWWRFASRTWWRSLRDLVEMRQGLLVYGFFPGISRFAVKKPDGMKPPSIVDCGE